ncbi:hypothetical protein [Nesterenkonia rhizosphaerae]|uniref:Uncharacterized protein n=1 Tax=Nesterenkonia rhizosphaerae TaxID=1348272 RepID=A0ABP9FZN5_9MICC
MSRDDRDQRGGHQRRPEKINLCGCWRCTDSKTKKVAKQISGTLRQNRDRAVEEYSA